MTAHPYDGAWLRTALYEPRDAPASADDTIVLWLQAGDTFVDVRVPPARHSNFDRRVKSFAGATSVAHRPGAAPVLTWHRKIDIRSWTPQADAGAMTSASVSELCGSRCL